MPQLDLNPVPVGGGAGRESGAVAAADMSAARESLRVDRNRLREWLLEEALPLWSTRGIDPRDGGFEERLSTEGTPTNEARRARVQPRQLFAFVGAWQLGWPGGAQSIVERGAEYFERRFRRADGLYRTLIAAGGAPLDESVYLYDQAFALLGLAAARRICGEASNYEPMAQALLERIQSTLAHEEGGFENGLVRQLPLLSNPHMHLLEACLEWQQLSTSSCWRTTAEHLIDLALRRFIDPSSGLLREYFAADWSPAPLLAGRRIDPGHQFEWAWLLMSAQGEQRGAAHSAAMRLIEGTERLGIRGGAVLDEILDDGTVHLPTARLWPQTERLRSLACAAASTGELRYWVLAHDAARSVLRYLNATLPGLWHDELLPDGRFRIGPAPAGNLYHLVGAILALDKALAATGAMCEGHS